MNENDENNEEPKDPSNQEFDSIDKGKESQGCSNLEYDQADEADISDGPVPAPDSLSAHVPHTGVAAVGSSAIRRESVLATQVQQ